MTIKNYLKNTILGLGALCLTAGAASGCAITIKPALSTYVQECLYDTDGNGRPDTKIQSAGRQCKDIEVFIRRKNSLKYRTEQTKKQMSEIVNEMLGEKADPEAEARCLERTRGDPTDPIYCKSDGEVIVAEADVECQDNPQYLQCMQDSILSTIKFDTELYEKAIKNAKEAIEEKTKTDEPDSTKQLTPKQKKGFARMEYEIEARAEAKEMCEMNPTIAVPDFEESVKNCVQDLVNERMADYDRVHKTPKRKTGLDSIGLPYGG